MPQGPVLALSFQGRSASIPILDYSRTGRYLNEEVVILRELFVKRKPLTGVRSFPALCLFFLGRERPEGKDPISPLGAAPNIVSAS
jgi:hypothetical protein